MYTGLSFVFTRLHSSAIVSHSSGLVLPLVCVLLIITILQNVNTWETTLPPIIYFNRIKVLNVNCVYFLAFRRYCFIPPHDSFFKIKLNEQDEAIVWIIRFFGIRYLAFFCLMVFLDFDKKGDGIYNEIRDLQ